MSALVWFDEEAIFDSLVVLTDEVAYVANPTSEAGKAMAAQLEQGEPASRVMKDEGTTILLSELNRVRWNRKSDDIDLRWTKKGETKNVSFPSSTQRDEFAAALIERVHGFKSKTVEFGRVRSALLPSTWSAGTAFFTFLFYQAALAMQAGEEATIEGRHSAIKKMVAFAIDVIGPIGVLVVGGLMFAGSIAWLVKRVGDPPIVTTLTPAK